MQPEINAIIQILSQRLPCLRLALLFGSFSSNDHRADSDIDIAFAAAQALDSKTLFNLKLDLQTICDRHVDLIDLNNADTSIVLKHEIVTLGKILFACDETVFSTYEARIRREAEDFLYRRRDLEDHLAERLRAYATT
jgi:predicted nucleotidyltransferase